MEPKVPEDIYKSHLDNSKYNCSLFLLFILQELSFTVVNNYLLFKSTSKNILQSNLPGSNTCIFTGVCKLFYSFVHYHTLLGRYIFVLWTFNKSMVYVVLFESLVQSFSKK